MWESGRKRQGKGDAVGEDCNRIGKGSTDSEWDVPLRWGVCLVGVYGARCLFEGSVKLQYGSADVVPVTIM